MHDYIWTMVGIAAAALTSFSFIPQVRKMQRRRSVGDVSNVTMFQMMAGNTLWFVYGIARRDAVIIGANIIAITILIIGLTLYYRYREKKAGGVIHGTLLGAQELGADPLVAVSDSSRGLVMAAAESGQDVTAMARAAVEEAIEGTKAADIDVKAEAAAMAAAAGAVEAAAEIDNATEQAVREAVSDIIGEASGDIDEPNPPV
jgi:MtN3 and saliva related transmembrane protein